MSEKIKLGIGNWGRWGDDDQRGALNLLTPERVIHALRAAKKGKVYSLGLPIQTFDVPGSSSRIRPPPLHLMSVDGGDWASGSKPRGGVKVADDYLFMACGSGTAIEALCHLWIGDEMYNGFSGNLVKSSGAKRLGIENTGWIVTRGIMLDIAAFKQVHHLQDYYEITREDIEECAQAEGVELGAGDALLIRTGYMALWDGKSEHPGDAESGIGMEVAQLIRERDICVVGADNGGVELVTPQDIRGGRYLPVRVELIRNLGVYMLEMLYLEELARDKVYECLLVVAPLKITGATHSPVNPIAIA